MTTTDNAVVLYQTPDGTTSLAVHLEKETVWLTQKQMADLFGKTIPTINEHIKNVFKEGELDEGAVIRNFRITAADGKTYDTAHYNLDVIISVSYRVKSQQGTRFRQWATNVLKDHIVQPEREPDRATAAGRGADRHPHVDLLRGDVPGELNHQ